MGHRTMDNATPTDHQPLYVRVKNLLVKRIGSGSWKPGEMLPNEFQLASEYQVSQGTVRKALMALEADRLIVRKQGRGTYVARHTRDAALFHFFRMVGLNDHRVTPASIVLKQAKQRATGKQARHLSVAPGEILHVITRVRRINDVPIIFERIFVPFALMPDLAVQAGGKMDDEMYVIYQEQFGISIARASERLAAVAATSEEARHLDLEVGAPLLEISRLARDVNGRAVELRVSRCNTSRYWYAAEVY